MSTFQFPIECICLVLEHSDHLTKITFSMTNSEFYDETLRYFSPDVPNALLKGDLFSLMRCSRSDWNAQDIYLTRVCELGNLDLLKHFISVCSRNLRHEVIPAMYVVAKLGNAPMFKYLNTLIVLEALNGHLIHCACVGGNIEIFNISVEQYGREFNSSSWLVNMEKPGVSMLYSACRGGNIDIVQKLLDLGFSDHCDGLLGACESGHLQLAKVMVELIKHRFGTCRNFIDQSVRAACEGGHLELVKYFINLGFPHYASMLYYSCLSANSDLPLFILGFIESGKASLFYKCLNRACRMGHYQLAVELIKRGGIVDDRVIASARASGVDDLVVFLMSQVKIYDHELLEAGLSGNVELFRELLNKHGRISKNTVSILRSKGKHEILDIIAGL